MLTFHPAKALAMAAAMLAAGAAWAQAYPSKSITMIVPYAVGGPTDIVARVVAAKLSQLNGNIPVIVENKPGGGSNIGAELAARAPADGYTMMVTTATHAINVSLFPNLKYDLQKDFAPVTLLTSGPLVLVTHPKLPAKNLAELVALAKAKPGELSFASSGNGASTHLGSEMFNVRAGISTLHVPYKGSGPALTDLVSGQINYMFDTMLSAMPFVNSGRLKPLAVTSLKRSAALPDVPTVAEQGYPGFEAIAWNGMVVPAKTPPEIVARLNSDLKKILEMPDVKEKFAAQGFAAEWQSPETFGKFIKAEVQKWGGIVKAAKVSIE